MQVTRADLDHTALKKQSDLGLHSVMRDIWNLTPMDW